MTEAQQFLEAQQLAALSVQVRSHILVKYLGPLLDAVLDGNLVATETAYLQLERIFNEESVVTPLLAPTILRAPVK